MAEVAPSAGGGGGNRNFLLIIGGLAALLIIGLLALGAIFLLPGLLGGSTQIAGLTPTPTRISIPPTNTRTPPPSPTLVVVDQNTPVPDATLEPGSRVVKVTVGDGNAVTLSIVESGSEVLSQKGSWQFDPSNRNLVLNFTELNGQPFPDKIVLQLDGSNLVPVFYNKALHGNLQNITLERAGGALEAPVNQLVPRSGGTSGEARPAAQATATAMPVSGSYSGVEPPTEPGIRVMTLFLGPESVAVMSTGEKDKMTVLQIGTWAADGNNVTVTLKQKDGAPFEETLKLTYEGGKLTGTTTDPEFHGAAMQFTFDQTAPSADAAAPAGTYQMTLNLNATPIPITATPIAITATPQPGAKQDNLPETGLGEDLLMLFGGGILLLGLIVVVRRMRTV